MKCPQNQWGLSGPRPWLWKRSPSGPLCPPPCQSFQLGTHCLTGAEPCLKSQPQDPRTRPLEVGPRRGLRYSEVTRVGPDPKDQCLVRRPGADCRGGHERMERAPASPGGGREGGPPCPPWPGTWGPRSSICSSQCGVWAAQPSRVSSARWCTACSFPVTWPSEQAPSTEGCMSWRSAEVVPQATEVTKCSLVWAAGAQTPGQTLLCS